MGNLMITLRSTFAIAGARCVPEALVVLVMGYLYFHLNIGQPMNEDYAVYLQEAYNIAHHIPLADMGVIHEFDPARTLSQQGPLTYPPLVPLLYAIPVYVMGFNLDVFKYTQFIILTLSVALFCRAMLSWHFNKLEVSTSILLFGLSVETLRSINDIGSDIPFLAVLIVSLLSIDKFVRSTGRTRIIYSLLCGLAIFLAIDTRTIGAVLLPTLVCADLFFARGRSRLEVLLPITAVVVLWVLQKTFLGAALAYDYLLNFQFFTPITIMRELFWALVSPWQNTAVLKLAEATYVAVALLTLYGVMPGIRKGEPVSLFILFYMALLLMLPDFDAGARYLMPVMLFMGALMMRGTLLFVKWLGLSRNRQQTFGTLITIAVTTLLLIAPSPLPADTLPFGAESLTAQSAFTFVRTNVPTDSLIGVSKFSSFHLFTQRRTIAPQKSALLSTSALLNWCRSRAVTYIVIKYSRPISKYDFSDCPENPLCVFHETQRKFTMVFQNSDFKVFQIPD